MRIEHAELFSTFPLGEQTDPDIHDTTQEHLQEHKHRWNSTISHLGNSIFVGFRYNRQCLSMHDRQRQRATLGIF
jgi:hypothetical protein